MKPTGKNMVLVVDRSTRRIIDSTVLEYTWRLEELVAEHDLEKVDLIIRPQYSTKPDEVIEAAKEPDFSVETPLTTSTEEEDDIPF